MRFDDLEELHDGDGWVHQEHVIEDALVQLAGNIKNMSLKTPWCILQVLTAVSKMERFEHCWRHLSDKTGQPLHGVIHQTKSLGEPMFIRASQVIRHQKWIRDSSLQVFVPRGNRGKRELHHPGRSDPIR